MRPNEPIAIIGIGCRLPGNANDPDSFWELLKNGVDTVGEVPPDRWNAQEFLHSDRRRAGKMYTSSGAFIKNIDLFDAEFFGISPREASRMDPQHRLLLEVAWEALEHAGQPIDKLAASRTAVFIGSCYDQYRELQYSDSISINAYTNVGTAPSLAANRISHALDLRGPSMTLDTACSSSLVAVHLACESLWRQESTLALAGGVQLMLTAAPGIGLCRSSMLSPDGRCRTFDANADGFARGEGLGLVVLKPLSTALRDRDPIVALILATGTNQDGYTVGISAPNGAAQETLLREVYAKAGIEPFEVQYVEAHGTGTLVGDPIECNALGNVLGEGRPAGSFCRIGSVKTNLGHLEGAAGIAGLIKVALALRNRYLPPSLHFKTPNPNIDFERLRLRVQSAGEPWPDCKNAVAGVGAFGFGGSNAHIVLKAFEQEEDRPAAATKLSVLPISARSAGALDSLAKAYWVLLRDPNAPPLGDLCYTAAVRRTHHDHRLSLVGDSPAQMVERLNAFLAKERAPGLSWGHRSSGGTKKIAFAFAGNGPQWWGMARQLLESDLVFRETIRTCDSVFVRLAGWPISQELLRNESESRMHLTSVAQPALFAVQVGLLALWKSWGVEPSAIVGHSAGEVAAAYAAGILSLDDALTVVYHRSQTQELAAGKGGMLAVGMPPDEAQKRFPPGSAPVCLACCNSPSSVTLSGDADALEDLFRSLSSKGAFCRMLRLSYPFHSHYMDPLRDDLVGALQDIFPRKAKIRMVSSVTGSDLSGEECGPGYWWRNTREPVMFAQAVDRLLDDDFDAFLEIGPHPVLGGYIGECAAALGRSPAIVPSLRRHEDDRTMLLGSLGTLYTAGCSVPWEKVCSGGGRVVSLPTYRWQEKRHWNQPSDRSAFRKIPGHPLLGRRIDSPEPCWYGELDKREIPFLDDHRVQGATIFPAAAFVEMIYAAGAQVFRQGAFNA